MNADDDPADDQQPAWITPAVRALPPYRGPKTFAVAGGARMRPLHLNESPYPPSPRVAEAIHAQAKDLNRYPDIHAPGLARAIAARTGIDPQNIVFGCGSDELIHFLCEIALAEGDSCVVPAPSFPRYALSTRLRGATPLRAKLDEAGACDPATLAAAINNRTRLVFACTPNPPSGGLMSAEALTRVVESIPADILLVVDEAYHEFGHHAGGPDVLAIVTRRRGPWALLRTFSKAYGLSAMRVGYALCGSAAVAGALLKAKLQFNVTSLSQAAALAAFEDEAYLRKILDLIGTERTRLTTGLKALGLEPYRSAANFVSAKTPMAAAQVMAALEEKGILIRDWRDPDYLREIRITVGLPDDTDAVLSALREILGDR